MPTTILSGDVIKEVTSSRSGVSTGDVKKRRQWRRHRYIGCNSRALSRHSPSSNLCLLLFRSTSSQWPPVSADLRPVDVWTWLQRLRALRLGLYMEPLSVSPRTQRNRVAYSLPLVRPAPNVSNKTTHEFISFSFYGSAYCCANIC